MILDVDSRSVDYIEVVIKLEERFVYFLNDEERRGPIKSVIWSSDC